ncbi:MAG: peptidoglycan DD-metalloendopeptidase family protein [Bryobacteraceae bacterium]
MDQSYFVVDAQSSDGRIRQIHITRKSIAWVLGAIFLVFIFAAVLFSSYVQMSWKVAHYDQLRAQFNQLRGRYQELQRISRQHSEQMAALENLATEVSVSYGINQHPFSKNAATRPSAELSPSVKESIEEYNFLKSANFSSIYHHFAYQWQVHSRPSLWPVNGILSSSFGGRTDPFSGEGAFHTGIDLATASRTPVHVTADGVVLSAGWSGAYGKLVVVDHGNGLETYYAHLSQWLVIPGQEVRLGEVIGLSGATGRVTSPHVHYEVRVSGTPVNPYRYLAKAQRSQPTHPAQSDLGL